jgi:hypothetical protein
MKEKQKVITGYRSRYRKAGRKEKTAILNEVRFITGYNRKYALRILNQHQAPRALLMVNGETVKLKPRKKRPANRKGKKIYTDEVILKEHLYGFTREEIFDKKSRKRIREISPDTVLKFQINQLMDRLERDEADVEALKEQVLLYAEPYMGQIDILTSMKGVSVFIAIAIIADIIDVSRFKDSKHFTSYLRSAPHVANSNTSTSSRGTNKKGRKLSSSLLTQSLNHVLNTSLKLRRWYDRLSEYKKAGLVRTGLRRRVFAEIYQMLKKGEYHYDRDAHNHETKMTQYRKFLEKNGGNLEKTA